MNTVLPGLLAAALAFASTAQAVSFLNSSRLDIPVPADVIAAVAADFNSDGKPDFVVIDDPQSLEIRVWIGNGDGTFHAGQTIPVTTSITSALPQMAGGDFDGGRADFALLTSAGSVSIFFGNGDGTFRSSNVAQITQPQSVAAVDFNHDGKTDLIAVLAKTNGSQPVTVYLSQGNGSFQSSTSTSVATQVNCGVNSVAAGDFNGDGKFDLAIGVCSELVLYVSGSGGTYSASPIQPIDPFNPTGQKQVISNVTQIAAADMNGDGKIDLVMDMSYSTLVLLGDGTGNFAVSDVSTGGGRDCLLLADFNGDGALDILGGYGKSESFSIQLGNGDGSMQPPAVYGLGGGFWNVPAIADFNHDGNLDLVFGVKGDSYSAPYLPPYFPGGGPSFGGVSVLFGSGEGTFPQPSAYYAPFGAGFVTTGDWNGDGKPDLAFAATYSQNTTPNTIGIMLNRGDGTFAPAASVTVGQQPSAIVSGDFDGDQKMDLAVANAQDNTVTILLGNGDGTFRAQPAIATGLPTQGFAPVLQYAMVAGDFNQDNKLDLAITSDNAGTVAILLGNGLGGFSSGPSLTTSDTALYALASGDFNGDGKLDLIASGNQDIELFTDGGGAFSAGTSLRTTGAAGLAVADLNGDKILDLVAADLRANTVTVFLGAAGGTFSGGTPMDVGAAPGPIVIADYDGDGKLDLAVGNTHTNDVSILINAGGGSFEPAVFFGAGMAMQWMAGADFNGDGMPDLAVSDQYNLGVLDPGIGAPGAIFELLNGNQRLGTAGIVTVGANAGGLTFTLDGNMYSAPQTFVWASGNEHTVTWNSPQTLTYPGQSSTQITYAFQGWSNGDRHASRSFTPPVSSATLNGNFQIGGYGQGIMLTPEPGTSLTSAQQAFAWSAAPSATQYRLDIGNSPGAADIFTKTTSATSVQATGLPTDGRTIFARLTTQVAGFPAPTTYEFPGAVATPVINSGGIVIHGSAVAVVSPGALVDIYGTNLAAAPATAPAGTSFPTTLGGVQVFVNKVAVPLIYVSPLQIIFQIPYEAAIGSDSVVVMSNNISSSAGSVTVQNAAPFILTYNGNRAIVQNQDSSVNASNNGAPPASYMTLWLIGSGPLDNPIPTGATAPVNPLSRETLPTTVTVGGQTVQPVFAGMAPYFAGLMQIDFQMPALAPGDYPMQVSIGGTVSNQPLITVSK